MHWWGINRECKHAAARCFAFLSGALCFMTHQLRRQYATTCISTDTRGQLGLCVISKQFHIWQWNIDNSITKTKDYITTMQLSGLALKIESVDFLNLFRYLYVLTLGTYSSPATALESWRILWVLLIIYSARQSTSQTNCFTAIVFSVHSLSIMQYVQSNAFVWCDFKGAHAEKRKPHVI